MRQCTFEKPVLASEIHSIHNHIVWSTKTWPACARVSSLVSRVSSYLWAVLYYNISQILKAMMKMLLLWCSLRVHPKIQMRWGRIQGWPVAFLLDETSIISVICWPREVVGVCQWSLDQNGTMQFLGKVCLAKSNIAWIAKESEQVLTNCMYPWLWGHHSADSSWVQPDHYWDFMSQSGCCMGIPFDCSKRISLTNCTLNLLYWHVLYVTHALTLSLSRVMNFKLLLQPHQ